MGDSFSFANPRSRGAGLGQEQTSDPTSPGLAFSGAGSAPFAGANVNQMREEMNRMISSPNPGASWMYSERGQKDSLQRQMTVGSANDPLEKEADSVADYVVRDMSDYYLDPRAGRLPSAQREVSAEDEEMQQQSLQRNLAGMDEDAKETLGYTHAFEKTDEEDNMGKTTSIYMDRENAASPEGGTVSPDLQRRIESVRNSGGEQIPNGERDFFESRMGRDFSDVRIHTGGDAAQVSREVNAKAFMIGRDVVFGEGQYQPGTQEGRRLMAHELTHTVQQGAAKSIRRNEDKSNPFTTRIFLKNGKVLDRVAIVRQDSEVLHYRVASGKVNQVPLKSIRKIAMNQFYEGMDNDRNQLNNPVTDGIDPSGQCGPTSMTGMAQDLGLSNASLPSFDEGFNFEKHLIASVKANADLTKEQVAQILGVAENTWDVGSIYGGRTNTKDGRVLLMTMYKLYGGQLAPLNPKNFREFKAGGSSYIDFNATTASAYKDFFLKTLFPAMRDTKIMLFIQSTSSGHFVRLVDVLPDGIVVNDPYGLFKYSQSSYDKNSADSEASVRQFYTWQQVKDFRLGASATFLRLERNNKCYIN